ncbi:hypothetical protein WN944_014105 [Citrus x changshan-huyou]|uniref:Uncharacterized protein n=1 Tax=Citrus x changshan-huyou TaxID=2935761 RepID=A0AAP0QLA4_9ROSI
MGSPNQGKTLSSSKAKCKLKLEMQSNGRNEVEAMLTEESTAVAGYQPRQHFTVDKSGLGSGLALLWSVEIVVDIKSYSMHHIDAIVQADNGCYWRCRGIYGHPEGDQKHHT